MSSKLPTLQSAGSAQQGTRRPVKYAVLALLAVAVCILGWQFRKSGSGGPLSRPLSPLRAEGEEASGQVVGAEQGDAGAQPNNGLDEQLEVRDAAHPEAGGSPKPVETVSRTTGGPQQSLPEPSP